MSQPDARTPSAATTLPWGETMDELAMAVLADKSAPPVLLLAAFLHQRGEPGRLGSLIQSALDLEARDAATA